MAAFWEYARESKPLRNAFETGPKVKEKEIQSLLPVLSPDEMRLLASPYFPALSFEHTIGWNLLDKGLHTSTDFGTTAVGFLPIEQFVPFALWLRRQKIVANWTIHGAKIEWDYTDAELSDMFRAQLKDLRPVELPEPKRAGRAGRLTAISPVDSLNQLAALRLEREGFTFFNAATREVVSRTPYTSVKGWKLGIRSAQVRINNMASVPFFKKRQESTLRK